MTDNDLSSAVVIVNNEGMGHSERELRLKLIETYFRLLNERDVLPNAICFYADGVKLLVDDSPVLDGCSHWRVRASA